MKNISFLTIQEIKKDLEKKEYSIPEVVSFFIERFQKLDHKIQSAIQIFDKESIIAKSDSQGVLYGIPGIIKDNICQNDRFASCASKILENYKAPYDATVIELLKKEGAFLIGRANLDEFAMGSSTETSAFLKTKNPWNLNCVPGGSSGGSAAAVSAGLVPWALGSETGGSVRHPAAFCGIVGFKPTYGSISRYGLIAYASSLDQIGIMARSVYDVALIYSVIAGHDKKDASSLPQLQAKNYTEALTGQFPKKLKIGVIKTAFDTPGMDEQIKEIIIKNIEVFKQVGVEIVEIELPTLEYALATYFIISRAEAASNLSRFDGVRYGYRDAEAKDLNELYVKSRSYGFGKEVKARMLIGNYVLSAGYAGKFYHNARKVQQLISQDFQEAFSKVDLLIAPTQSTVAFEFGKFDNDKLKMDLQDYLLAPINLAGIPAITVPCGFTQENMPVGMQIIGPHLSEQLIFQVAHAYQQITDWHKKHPSL